MESIISKSNPKLSTSSIRTYSGLISKLFYTFNSKNEEPTLEWFRENRESIVKYIENKPLNTKHTILSVIRKLLPDDDHYKGLIANTTSLRRDDADSQKRTAKQSENWIEFKKVREIYDRVRKETEPILKKRTAISNEEFMKLQDLVILSLCSGIWFPPRRAGDWVYMKIRNIEKSKDNFIDSKGKEKRFVLNKYKTASTYGQQVIPIPNDLMRILKAYIAHNPYEYLLVDNMGKQFTNSRLTKTLNRLFGSKVSVDMLRHIYITDKAGNMPHLREIQKTATAMGHSVMENLQYIRR